MLLGSLSLQALMKVEFEHTIAHIVSETSTLRHLPPGRLSTEAGFLERPKRWERSKPVHSFILLRKLRFIATHVAIASPAPHSTPMAMCHEQRSLQGVVIPPVTGIYTLFVLRFPHVSTRHTFDARNLRLVCFLVISSWLVEYPCDGYRTLQKSICSQC